ncbi:MAG: flagellar biosynthesis protein FlhF [Sedimenticola sp.]|uniref:Flagellar biosynthesis protein FlhF n=1 Tax=Sedimenticola thiotaurini TaxID=1543721 RepID=A0A558D3G8_9GAMM|nr:flagellar biosynthesis protein FlhF [Sedimenticola sp.]MCW8947274.1 flagellar biosynthesis protein FlhF [Sedimenticola sp.]MCW8976992.1 flagellar biosynthesis protein FlhF [Sedimenticola sp.]MCW9022027.1 flagellar biosynthesis protein FlhF [Sedimenticola sp.]TVT55560.1 MAG: flagellar biosynthesis protein FlhF [Sedimenticola thiotaurini]
MKIKRFFASDIRQALRQVREALGSDAVILSNKKVDGGIELVAAIDYDATAFTPQVESKPESPAQPTPILPQAARSKSPSRPQKQTPAAVALFKEASTSERSIQPPNPKIEWSQDPVLVEMRQEMKALRRLLENDLSGLSWREMGDHKPETQDLFRRLMALSITPDICSQLVEAVANTETADQAWRKALYYLATKLETVGDDLLDQGGIFALIGPTGVGKTTTIAKLAARFALRHGNRQVALISTDNYRIGAQEQLNTYARILDVPVRSAGTREELAVALNALTGKRLILIDTAGMSQRDVRLSEQLSLLDVAGQGVQSFLTLSAATDYSSMVQAITAFGAANPAACILTKVDEAGSLGGALSALIHKSLPLAFVADGQKVPEDLHLARSHTLVSKAVACSNGGGEYSDEYLALALGGARANAHG